MGLDMRITSHDTNSSKIGINSTQCYDKRGSYFFLKQSSLFYSISHKKQKYNSTTTMNTLHFTTCCIMKDNSPMKTNNGPHDAIMNYNSEVVLTSMLVEEMFKSSVSPDPSVSSQKNDSILTLSTNYFTTCSITKNNSPMKSNDGPHESLVNNNSKLVSTSMPLKEIFTTSVSTESNAVGAESKLPSPAVRILYMPPLFRANECFAKVERHAWDDEDEISIIYLGWPECPIVAAMIASREPVSTYDDFGDKDSMIGIIVDTAAKPDDAWSVESCVTTYQEEWDDDNEYWALFSGTAQTTDYDNWDQEYARCDYGQYCSRTEETTTESFSTSTVLSALTYFSVTFPSI